MLKGLVQLAGPYCQSKLVQFKKNCEHLTVDIFFDEMIQADNLDFCILLNFQSFVILKIEAPGDCDR